MGRINKKRQKKTDRDMHMNWMGGASWDVSDPVKRLRLAASCCFFGEPMYYHREKGTRRRHPSLSAGRDAYLSDSALAELREMLNALDPQDWRNKTPADLLTSAIDAALDADPEGTLREAARLRTEEFIRTTPQVIMVRAANHTKVKGTGLIRKYRPYILQRADEPAVQMAYQLEEFGREGIPNALKRAWCHYLEGASEYALAKYRMDNRVVKTVDVVNLVHAKGDAIDKLVRGKLSVRDRTWEGIISTKGSNTEAWTEAVKVMGHMALLRNLRNLHQHGVDPSLFVEKLILGARKGKQLPFRYWSAYKALEEVAASGRVLDAVEACLRESLGNLPRFAGKAITLSDNSGSAWYTGPSEMSTTTIAEIGNLMGILTGMVADDGYAGVFGDGLEVMPVRKRSSVFDQTEKLTDLGNNVGMNTEAGIWIFLDRAIRQREHWDHMFVFSDMQAGHGGLYGCGATVAKADQWGSSRSSCYSRYIHVPRMLNRYRTEVNPNVLVYLVQIAGYQDTIVPEWYDRTFILGGWGPGIYRFAAEMAGMYGQQTKQ